MTTYTLTTDYHRLGKKGATIEMPEAAARYLVLGGVLTEAVVKPAPKAAPVRAATPATTPAKD